jgi:hypothetical protein
MDFYHWQTPVFADVFPDETANTPEVDKLRLQAYLVDQFAKLGINLTVQRAKTMPSYTFYEAALNESVEADTLREHIYHIETERGWTIGFSQSDDNYLQLLVRTQYHVKLSLSQIISRGTFLKSTNLSSLVVGVNLQQQILVSHWEAIRHMLIVGDRATKETFIQSVLLTQLMLNTPGELRIAFLGQNLEAYRYLQESPHSLGDTSKRSPEQGVHLIVGLNRELQRRQLAFTNAEVSSLDECNASRLDAQSATFPRIILVLDNLDHAEWAKYQEQWLTPFFQILEYGAQYGIHILLSEWTLQLPEPFDEIRDRVLVRLIARSLVENMDTGQQLKDVHPSLMRFVDAFFVRGVQWTPLEIAGISPDAVRSLVVYWRQAAHHRVENAHVMNLARSTATSRKSLLPGPEKPSKAVLVRATEQLVKVLETDELEMLISANQDENEMTEAHKIIMTEADQTLGIESDENGELSISFDAIQKAQALATYLGWLGIGPLIDILGLSQKEAETIIAILQARQILERSKSPTPYLRVPRKK